MVTMDRSYKKPIGRRRLARERCLQALYLSDIAGLDFQQILSVLKNEFPEFDEKTFSFYNLLLSGTLKNIARINEVVSKYAKNWTIERMSCVDRCILRLAAFELLYTPETPVAAVMDEAIEIAKKYSSEKSSKFINGVLDNIKKERYNDQSRKRD